MSATRTASQSMLGAVSDPLATELRDARARTLLLVQDLDDVQWMGPRLPIVNPLLWEVGHLGWFQELWTLRHARGCAPLLADGDALYDSAKVAHDTRWDLPLLPRSKVLAYLEQVLGTALEVLGTAPDRAAYFHRLALFHEDMHGEALTYTRQTLGHPAPRFAPGAPAPGSGPLAGDVDVAGRRFMLGALMYFPAKFRIKVLDPVHFDVPPDQERYSRSRVMDEAESIRVRMQETLYDMLRARKSIWLG